MNEPKTFTDLINIFLNLIISLIPVVASLGLLAFFWGLTKFIVNVRGGEKAVTEGKNFMVWGTIGMFVMLSIWGILRFLHQDIGFGVLGIPELPTK